MTVQAAATTIVGILGLLNLLLTYGVIRRLRQMSSANRSADRPPIMADPGTAVGTALAAADVEPEGETVFAFFAHGCSACDEHVPEFLEYARGNPRVVAVVQDTLGEGADLVERLASSCRVIVQRDLSGPIQESFQIQAYPSYCLVRDGVIASVSRRVAQLPKLSVHQPA